MAAPLQSNALLWPSAVEKNTPPLLHYFKQHSGPKTNVTDSQTLLAIGQEASRTWKLILRLHFPSEMCKMAAPLWWRFQVRVCKPGVNVELSWCVKLPQQEESLSLALNIQDGFYVHSNSNKNNPTWWKASLVRSWDRYSIKLDAAFSAVPRLTPSDCQSPCRSTAPRLRCHLPLWPLTSVQETGATEMLKFLSDMDQWLQQQCDPGKINTGVYLVGVWEACRL